MIAIAGVFLLLCQGDLEPCVLESYPNPERSWEYRLNLISDLNLSLPDSQMASLSRVPGQAGPRAGRIGFFDPATRKIQYAQFSTVDDPEAFFEALRTEHEGLEFTVKKRAAKTILEGEFRRGLFSVPYHVVYEDGLALFGSTAAVSSVNSAKIRTLMRDSSRDERTVQFLSLIHI